MPRSSASVKCRWLPGLGIYFVTPSLCVPPETDVERCLPKQQLSGAADPRNGNDPRQIDESLSPPRLEFRSRTTPPRCPPPPSPPPPRGPCSSNPLPPAPTPPACCRTGTGRSLPLATKMRSRRGSRSRLSSMWPIPASTTKPCRRRPFAAGIASSAEQMRYCTACDRSVVRYLKVGWPAGSPRALPFFL